MSRVQQIQDALLEGEDPGIAVVETVEEIAALPASADAVYVIDLDDAKLAALSRLHELVWLGQGGSPQVTDKGVAHLGRMPKLEALDLEGCTQLTDAALRSLAAAPALAWVDLGSCEKLTSAALDAFEGSRPGLVVLR